MFLSYRMGVVTCLMLMWFSGESAVTQAQQPLSLHPQNDRYFLFRDRPTVLVTSAEHYGVLLNRAFDFEPYLDELAAQGLNHTRVFSGAYREIKGSFGITQNTLAPQDNDYVCPWKRSDKTHADGSPIFDLDHWDDAYFQRLDALMKAASRRGIVVEMCLFSPMYKPALWDVNPMNIRNNVNEVGDCGSQQVYTTENPDLLRVQSALAEKMVDVLMPYDNVYLEICNEPYFGGVTDAWQRHIIDAVVAKQEQVGSKHLISINVANKTKRIENPHPAVSIFNFHYCYPPVVVEENSHVHGVIGENETGFRGSESFLYRTEGWDFLVAGGAIFNNLDYSFSAQHPDGTLTGYSSPGGGSRQLRRQLGVLKSTFDRLPIPDLEPQAKRFAKVPDGYSVSAIGQPKNVYLVYVHVDLPGRLKDQPAEQFTQANNDVQLILELPEGRYGVKQIDPSTGRRTDQTSIEAGSGKSVEITLQAFTTDTALLIESSK
ncbi:hypothetical protein NHH03_07935 [Stieleria sp. TO1_6]|uniref:hypothetical protein n=1 Tax=Stieleria tagensis TaxID=2956795 RepID=UPI00209B94FE|nr:hypothetical protein [Stieleria tagensis]MCO8121661.1 hypothetical protein [Stieleria tagensis]